MRSSADSENKCEQKLQKFVRVKNVRRHYSANSSFSPVDFSKVGKFNTFFTQNTFSCFFASIPLEVFAAQSEKLAGLDIELAFSVSEHFCRCALPQINFFTFFTHIYSELALLHLLESLIIPTCLLGL
jgi:hypothetical protein